MPFEMIVGLTVTNETDYARYREEMTPILQSHGGGFRFDFKIAEVLASEANHEINRVFAIYFKDREHKERFFGDNRYMEIRAKYLEKALNGRTLIAEYSRA